MASAEAGAIQLKGGPDMLHDAHHEIRSAWSVLRSARAELRETPRA